MLKWSFSGTSGLLYPSTPSPSSKPQPEEPVSTAKRPTRSLHSMKSTTQLLHHILPSKLLPSKGISFSPSPATTVTTPAESKPSFVPSGASTKIVSFPHQNDTVCSSSKNKRTVRSPVHSPSHSLQSNLPHRTYEPYASGVKKPPRLALSLSTSNLKSRYIHSDPCTSTSKPHDSKSISHSPPLSANTPPCVRTTDSNLLTTAEKHLLKHQLHPGFLSTYTLKEELGCGGFGFVCSAVKRVTDSTLTYTFSHPKEYQEVAVKFIFKNKVPNLAWASDPQLGVIPLEIYLVRQMHHDNIVAFVDFYEDEQFYYLVTELHGSPWSCADSKDPTTITPEPPCTQFTLKRRNSCDLFECIEQHQRLTEDQSRYIFQQIVSAVHYMHQLGIVHRDIKDENILIDQDLKVKLIDFGSAALVSPGEHKLFGRFLGTIQYAAPEILRGEKYKAPEAEVWALGCCLYIMLTGQVPFESPSQAIHQSYTEPCVRLSGSCRNLLDRMLEKDVSKRAKMADIVQHEWLLAKLF